MSLLSRISIVARSKINAFLDKIEDPQEQLDANYEMLKDELQNINNALVDITTERKRLENKRSNLEADIEEYEDKARQAVNQDEDELARKAIQKKKNCEDNLRTIEDSIESVKESEEQIKEKRDELEEQVQEFKHKKEINKARYKAAEVKVNVSESLNGLGDGVSVQEAMEDMEDKIEEKQARAGALEELEEESEDTIEEQLSEVQTGSEIDRELEQLREEVNVETEEVIESEKQMETLTTEI